MTAAERASLERQFGAKADVIVRALVELVDGTVDVVMLPGGWRIRLGNPPRKEQG